MRSSILFAAPLLAAAYAQNASANTTDISSSYTYSNALTAFLTQTNSLGVVTGMPAVETSQAALPPGVTSQPEVATIPAGLPVGTTYILQNISHSLTSFGVIVGSSTTVVISNVPTSTSVVTGSQTAGGSGSAATGTGSGDSGSGGAASGTSSANASSSSSAAASNLKLASAGVLGFGALFAALL